MITGILFGLALAQNPPPVDGAALISKMFAYYAGAKTMMGTIEMTQSVPDANMSITIDTTMAYEPASKLYVKQVLNAPTETKEWLVTSDGVNFTYDYPNQARDAASGPEKGRLWEAVTTGPNTTLTYHDIFRAATRSLGDLSFPELVAMAGTPELTTAKNQIVNITVAGADTINGVPVHILTGDWRLAADSAPSGKYSLFISDDGQLKRFAEAEMVGVSIPGANSKPRKIVTTWNVDLHPNTQPDESLFKVVK